MIAASHSGNILSINGREISFDYPIKEAFVTGDIAVVLLDPDSNLRRQGQFKNVIGFDAAGSQLWVAELPTEECMDTYYQIASLTPLKLSSVCSYECLVDPVTGKILTKSFYK